jgi:hypothetical protein
MKTLTLILAATAGLMLAAPAFANDQTAGQSNAQLVRADTAAQIADTDLSSAKKKKRKAVTNRSSWGG